MSPSPARNRPKSPPRKRKPRQQRREPERVNILGERPRPPFLHEEFTAPPTRPPERMRVRVNKQTTRYILWTAVNGVTPGGVESLSGIPSSTVSRVRTKARRDPREFLYCDFIIVVRGGKIGDPHRPRYFYCRMCGEADLNSGPMTTHAYGHIWDVDDLIPSWYRKLH